MGNLLDQFIEKGNLQSSPIVDDTFLYLATEYKGVISDIVRDEFLMQDATARRRNEERVLEVALSQFGQTPIPKIGESVTCFGQVYSIIEIESLDTTNVFYRIRRPI